MAFLSDIASFGISNNEISGAAYLHGECWDFFAEFYSEEKGGYNLRQRDLRQWAQWLARVFRRRPKMKFSKSNDGGATWIKLIWRPPFRRGPSESDDDQQHTYRLVRRSPFSQHSPSSNRARRSLPEAKLPADRKFGRNK